jgi:hypothetical protein
LFNDFSLINYFERMQLFHKTNVSGLVFYMLHSKFLRYKIEISAQVYTV